MQPNAREIIASMNEIVSPRHLSGGVEQAVNSAY